MQFKYKMSGILLSVFLVGCSQNAAKNPNLASTIVGSEPVDSSQPGAATAFAANVQTTFKTDAQGFKVNPLTAPANQIYYFAFDQSSMKSADVKALLLQADYLVNHPSTKVRLEGNTDNRGSREYNVALGWRRDQAVARLLEQQGVSPNQIDMVSFGKEKPVAFGNTAIAWSLNRRVNLIYVN